MASSSSCCPSGSWPALTEDTQRTLNGKEHTIASGTNCYSVPPAAAASGKPKKRAVVVVYDIYGFSGGRIKSVCDQIAKEDGYHVIMPDLFGNNQSIDDHGGFGSDDGMEFLRQHTMEKLLSTLDGVLDHLQTQVGVEKEHISALGFCWGVWVVFGMSKANMISAGAGCHPSLQIGEILFEPKQMVNDQAKNVTCPILLCPAGNDPDFVKENGSVQTIITKDKGLTCDICHFPDMVHGWVPRGDASDEKVARDVKAAISEVTSFFSKHT